MRLRDCIPLLLILGCTSRAEAPPAVSKPVVVELEEVQVRREEVVEPILGTGVIAAEKTTDIGPNVDGIVEEVFVEVGDRVHSGQALFRTRDTDCRIRLQERGAAVRLAEAEVAKAELDLQRTGELYEQNVVSSDRMDAATTAFRIAEARLESARAAYADAEQDLADTRVVAPYDGVVTGRFVDEGAWVRAMAGSAAPVIQIMKTDRVLAIIHVPEVHLPRIGLGTEAVVRIDGLDREYRSTVEIINDRVEPTSHSVEVRLPIPNPGLEIKPGLFAKAELRPASRSLLALRRDAVLGTSDHHYVFVERDGKAQRVAVEIDDLDAERCEILSGVDAGARVLLGARLGELQDGSPVRVSEVLDETL